MAFAYAKELVKNGKMYEAAVAETLEVKRFQINTSTLQRRVAAETKDTPAPPGRVPALYMLQEVEIASTCRYFTARGVPILKHEISQPVMDAYGDVPSMHKRYRNGIPGKD